MNLDILIPTRKKMIFILELNAMFYVIEDTPEEYLLNQCERTFIKKSKKLYNLCRGKVIR